MISPRPKGLLRTGSGGQLWPLISPLPTGTWCAGERGPGLRHSPPGKGVGEATRTDWTMSVLPKTKFWMVDMRRCLPESSLLS